MAFIFYNENPNSLRVGDCVVRAISKVEDMDWYDTYIDMCSQGMEMTDMPSSNRVWMAYLKEIGYSINLLPADCPNCYSIADFCKDYPKGSYLLATGSHLVAVVDGDYYDTWDSGEEVPIYYFAKKEDEDGTIQSTV